MQKNTHVYVGMSGPLLNRKLVGLKWYQPRQQQYWVRTFIAFNGAFVNNRKSWFKTRPSKSNRNRYQLLRRYNRSWCITDSSEWINSNCGIKLLDVIRLVSISANCYLFAQIMKPDVGRCRQRTNSKHPFWSVNARMYSSESVLSKGCALNQTWILPFMSTWFNEFH